MTKDEAIKKMKDYVMMGFDDPETGHYFADELLCAFLESEGHKDLVDLYNEVDKWYS